MLIRGQFPTTPTYFNYGYCYGDGFGYGDGHGSGCGYGEGSGYGKEYRPC